MRNTECLDRTADDYLRVFAEGKLNLPIAEIKAMIVDIVAHHPSVLAIATDVSQATEVFWAIDPSTAPPGFNVGLITGIINPALSYVRNRCPEFEGQDQLPGPTDIHLLSWPSDDGMD